MANLLGQFLASGGNLTPDDINPSNRDDIESALVRWLGRGRRMPYGMDEAQFREYVRQLRARPGQQNAILAEMGLAGANRQPPVMPLPPPVTPPPTATPPPNDFQWEMANSGRNPATMPRTRTVQTFTPPPETPPPTMETPPPAPPPTTTTADTSGIGPWTTTTAVEPNPLWADIGLGLRSYGNSQPDPAEGRINPISQGLLAGLGPPAPPSPVSWLSNPLDPRRSPRGRETPRYSSGIFG